MCRAVFGRVILPTLTDASDFYIQWAAPSHDGSMPPTCNAAAVLILSLKLAKARHNRNSNLTFFHTFPSSLQN